MAKDKKTADKNEFNKFLNDGLDRVITEIPPEGGGEPGTGVSVPATTSGHDPRFAQPESTGTPVAAGPELKGLVEPKPQRAPSPDEVVLQSYRAMLRQEEARLATRDQIPDAVARHKPGSAVLTDYTAEIKIKEGSSLLLVESYRLLLRLQLGGLVVPSGLINAEISNLLMKIKGEIEQVPEVKNAPTT